MIEILFSKIMQLASRLRKIDAVTSNTLFGDGILGNYYIGKSNEIPEKYLNYNTEFTTASGVCTIPLQGSYNFENLYIEKNCTLTVPTGIITIRVKNTLTLEGTISVANTMSTSIYSNGCPRQRSVLSSWAKQNMLTETCFYITGGTGNPGFFAATPSGGCVGVYYCNLYNTDGRNLGEDFNNSVLVNGSASGLSGGCLMIAANNIILGSSGFLNANGGTGEDTSEDKKGIFLNSRLRKVVF